MLNNNTDDELSPQEHFEKILLRWIVKNNQSLCICENQDFRNMLKFFADYHHLVSNDISSDRLRALCMVEAAAKKQEIKRKIHNKMLSITSDLWSSGIHLCNCFGIHC
jgi:hypothetical protein